MVSSSLNLRLLYNTVIQPLKDLAFERFLVAVERKSAHSPNRASAKQQRTCKNEPLDIIMNEQNPSHPVRTFSNTAIVQTRAFSTSLEHHGRTYQMGRRHTKAASTSKQVKSKTATKTPKTPPTTKRCRSAPTPHLGTMGRVRDSQKKHETVPKIVECSSEDSVSPCLGGTMQARGKGRSDVPMLRRQAFQNCNMNRQKSDIAEKLSDFAKEKKEPGHLARGPNYQWQKSDDLVEVEANGQDQLSQGPPTLREKMRTRLAAFRENLGTGLLQRCMLARSSHLPSIF